MDDYGGRSGAGAGLTGDAAERGLRALRTVRSCTRAIVREREEATLLQRICQALCEEGGYLLAWVGRRGEGDDRPVEPLAMAGRHEGYVETLRLSWDAGPCSLSPMGTALRTERPALCRFVARDPELAPWRPLALSRGFQSILALPLSLRDGGLIGALSVYAAEPDAFDEAEQGVLLELAEDLSYGVSVLRGRAARVAAEQKTLHLNRVLASLQGVARRLTRETDPDLLCEEVVNKLVAERGYESCCLFRTGEQGAPERVFVAGAERFTVLPAAAAAGKVPRCVRDVLEAHDVQVVRHALQDCSGCGAVSEQGSGERWALSAPLASGDRRFGALVAALDSSELPDAWEQRLFESSAGDVAHALYRIEVERAKAAGEAALRASEERFRYAFDNAPGGRALTGADGRLLRVNRAFAELLGRRPEDLAEQGFESVTHPDDLAASLECTRCLLAGERESYRLEKRYLRQDASAVWCDVSTTLLRDAAGRPEVFLTEIYDLSARKEAERGMARLGQIVRRSSTVAFSWLPEPGWPVDYVSPNVRRFGYEPEQLTAGDLPFADLIHPDDRERVAVEVERHAARRDAAYTQHYRLLTADGEVRWVEDRTWVQRGPAGEILAYEGLLEDVTERRLAAGALRLSEARLRALHELNQREFADEDELVRYALEQAVALTGSSYGFYYDGLGDEVDWAEFTWSAAVAPNGRLAGVGSTAVAAAGRCFEPLQSGRPLVGEGGGGAPPFAVELLPPGAGAIRRFMSAPVLDGERVVALGGMLDKASPYDESDLRQLQLFLDGLWRMVLRRRAEAEAHRLQEHLRQAQKMEAIGRLAGGVAHDFNNLLTAIAGYAELAADELPLGSTAREDIEGILAETGRAAALTRQLLAFSRKQVLQPRVLDLNGVVGGLEKMLRRLLGEDLRLEILLDPNLPRVMADPGQMEQVLLNLAVNSRDAMPGGGCLSIETRRCLCDQSYVQEHPGARLGLHASLRVRDEGAGMSPEVLERVFEPFFTTKEKGKGTGLGLATVYGIVQQSNGLIWAESQLGQGTAFEIHLPAIERPGRPVFSGPSVPVSSRGHETILLVEDEPAVAQLCERMLSAAGYRVRRASAAADALRLEASDPGAIDLLVTDVVMPGGSGAELAEALRLRRPGLRVLFISGYTDDALAMHGVLEPGVDLLQKPFGAAELARRVRQILDRTAAPT